LGPVLKHGTRKCRSRPYFRHPVSSFTITPPADPQESSKPQVCNPPYVYSLAWSPSGRLLAAGLGDGNCNVFSVQNRSLVQVGLLSPGHDASVASVLFPSFADSNERVVLSAGNDGAILCWDLGSNVLGEGDDAAASSGDAIFADSILQSNMGAVTNKMQNLGLDEPRVLFGLPHGLKPNWMVSQKSPGTLFVADTSNEITAYIIPLR
jgi:WD40 repeat protein